MSKLETGLHYPLKLDVLPEAWRIGHVGDFADEIQPGFASGKHNKEGAGIPHIRPYNIDRHGKLDLTEIKSVAPESDAKRLRTGDVLFNNTNSPELIGKTTVIVSAEDWGFSNHMTRIRFKDDVAPKFAAYQLHFLWMTGYYLHNCVKHVNQASISSKTLANAVPFIAPPFDQQKRIVAEIEKQFSRLDEAVANLKRVKANLKRYKAAVLKAAVEGRLVETEAERARREGRSFETGAQLLQRILETRRSQRQGKGKYKEPAAPDTTGLPELPEGWVWTSVVQVADVASGNTPAGILEAVKGTGDVPWFKVGDMNHEENQQVMRRADAWLSTSEVKKLGLRQFPPNTVLFPKRGGAIATNKKRRLELPGCADLNVMGITPVLEITSYLFTWFDGVNLAKLSDGSNVPQINHQDIEPLMIPLPPLDEQNRIVAEVDRRLSLLRETEAQVNANHQRADRLRQSILSTAFSGGLG